MLKGKIKIIPFLLSMLTIFLCCQNKVDFFQVSLPPTNLQVTPLSPFHVSISWERRGIFSQKYILERRKSGENWVSLGLIDSSNHYFIDTALNPGTEYAYRLGVLSDKGGCRYSEEVAVTTQENFLPEPEIQFFNPFSVQEGVTLFSIEDPDNILSFSALVAVDFNGRYIWMIGGEKFLVISDFEIMKNGHVLAMVGSGVEEITIEGERLWRYDKHLFHHDIDEAPWGTIIGVIGYREMGPEGIPFSADAIIEYDYEKKVETGIWPLKQIIPVEEFCSLCINAPDYFFGKDWTHTNAVVLGDDFEHVYLSVRNLDRIYRVSLKTGIVEWILGRGGDMGEGMFSHQHDPQITCENGEERILLFDNGLHRKEGKEYSRVVEIGIDSDLRKARKLWEYRENPDFYSAVGGGVQRLDNGNILITDSVNGRIVEVTSKKEVVWELDLPPPFAIFKSMRVSEWFLDSNPLRK